MKGLLGTIKMVQPKKKGFTKFSYKIQETTDVIHTDNLHFSTSSGRSHL